MNKALIAMSGGVDSSVAAYLMKEQGYSCMGVTMKLFHNEDVGLSREHTCCSLEDVEDARSVAYQLGIPYYVFCFVTNGKYTDFIESYTGKKYPKGNFVDLNGNILGTHQGIIHYTKGSHWSTIRTRLKVLKTGFFFVVTFAIPCIVKSFRLEKSPFSRL